MEETTLVFCAHSDDEIIGAGGTIARYTDLGRNVVVVIFSYGESSQPLIKESIIKSQRIQETKTIHKTLESETIYLGIPDSKIFTKINDKLLIKKICAIINKYKPNKIFTHSPSDILHPDHQSVYWIVSKALNRLDSPYSLYTFDVWNPFSIFKRNTPKLYVDITSTFDKKISLLKQFRSQIVFIYLLLPIVYLRALYHGRYNNCKYAEKFYKVR